MIGLVSRVAPGCDLFVLRRRNDLNLLDGWYKAAWSFDRELIGHSNADLRSSRGSPISDRAVAPHRCVAHPCAGVLDLEPRRRGRFPSGLLLLCYFSAEICSAIERTKASEVFIFRGFVGGCGGWISTMLHGP